MTLLDENGFAGAFNFLYLPLDSCTHCSVGYAFVNFDDASRAAEFKSKMSGYSFPGHQYNDPRDSRKRAMHISTAHLQGVERNLEHLRMSAVLTSNPAARPWFRMLGASAERASEGMDEEIFSHPPELETPPALWWAPHQESEAAAPSISRPWWEAPVEPQAAQPESDEEDVLASLSRWVSAAQQESGEEVLAAPSRWVSPPPGLEACTEAEVTHEVPAPPPGLQLQHVEQEVAHDPQAQAQKQLGIKDPPIQALKRAGVARLATVGTIGSSVGAKPLGIKDWPALGLPSTTIADAPQQSKLATRRTAHQSNVANDTAPSWLVPMPVAAPMAAWDGKAQPPRCPPLISTKLGY